MALEDLEGKYFVGTHALFQKNNRMEPVKGNIDKHIHNGYFICGIEREPNSGAFGEYMISVNDMIKSQFFKDEKDACLSHSDQYLDFEKNLKELVENEHPEDIL